MECGYDVPVVSDMDPRFQCPICLLVLREPVQTACGHRFCEGCIKRLAVPNNVLTCPVDKQYSRVNQMFPDVAIRREILSLVVQCTNEPDDCVWQGELRDLEKHRDRCMMESVSCPHGCDVHAKRWEMEGHLKDCPSRQVKCDHCVAMVVHSELKVHMDKCPRATVTCHLCGTAQMAREELAQHTDPDTGTCSSAIVCCPFNFVGCRFKAERYRVTQHTAKPETLLEHMSMAGLKLANHESIIQELRNQLNEYKTKADDTQAMAKENQKRQTQLTREVVERNVTGKLHWKVKVGGRSRNNTFISPELYTGCPGYKVRMVLELGGHVDRAVVYSGLYVELLRGDYDTQLIFPFNATCFVTLYDQMNAVSRRKNMTQTVVVREVPRVPRFKRTGDHIYRRGNSKFIRRNELVGCCSRYIKNDFIHVELTIVHCFYPPPDMSPGHYSPQHSPQLPSPITPEQAVVAAAAAAAAPILSIGSLSLGTSS